MQPEKEKGGGGLSRENQEFKSCKEREFGFTWNGRRGDEKKGYLQKGKKVNLIAEEDGELELLWRQGRRF